MATTFIAAAGAKSLGAAAAAKSLGAAAAAKPLAAAAAAKPLIDWGALFKVASVSAIFGIAVVTVFSLGILALTQIRTVQPVGASAGGTAPMQSGPRAGMSSSASYAIAAVCFAFCAAAVLFGLWLVVPQFH